MSKYKDVYNDIKNRIRDRILKPGEFLDSESELANEYSYSKDTIRKALSILELEGYIQKIKGKNSLILERGYLKNGKAVLTSLKLRFSFAETRLPTEPSFSGSLWFVCRKAA